MKVRIKRRRPVEEEQASLFQYKAGSPGLGSNPIAAATSLCLHVGVVILTLYSTFPYSDPIRYQVTTIHADSTELLWYFPQGRLPQVSSDQQLRAGIPKVRLKRPGQVMTADALQSHPGKQLIWQPPPQISSNQEVPSPNLFAFSAHPRRPEVRKEFIPPKLPNPVMTTPILPEATPLTPLSPTSFLPAMISGPVKQPLRDFVAPPVKSGIAPPTTILEAPPDLGSQVQTPQLAVVVVGLDPAMNGDIHLPEGVRDPQFSAGPDNGHGGHEPAPVVVPGLNVRGTGLPSPQVAAPAHKTLLPHHQPSTQEWLKAAPGKDSRRMARSMVSAPLRPGARVLAPALEARFPNRPVYTTAFEVGPHGSLEWVIWFAEQNLPAAQYATITPPVPWNRDDEGTESAFPPGAFELAAVINEKGEANSVTVIKGPDQTAREIAAKLIVKWTFLPALRNGTPITVDTLIDLSIRPKP